MHELGRTLIFVGLMIILVGLLVLGLDRLHLPLGRLPGDFSWRGRRWFVSFPLATSILVSIVLSVLLWVVGRMRH
jgi:hypothetical protein